MKLQLKKSTLALNKGFTLIEVMVVLLIIGIMAGIIAPQILGSQEGAQLKKAAVDIQQLESALEMYKLRNNVFPTTEQTLDALVNAPTIDPIPRNFPDGGFIKRLPQDPWGNDYQLLSPGELGAIDIFSNGPDLEAGTEDDIGNWNLNEYLN
ncbi:type II secretion system major pseudopilin GspG [Paraglaciecola aquimarina]|uniref:Type II secretion system core protein G n=1 Tax=Paraglaciecola aquimarina TaxID=1235557 RepID=A0ABU3ST88_9ALTE|nr:type II secretion system major pseudopilin GspG [Paraglaciecola aquimarina]MDU0353225.1 type II secretion system major pseudopilin GspG [Paraglaciecola aquimarina]